MLAFVVGGSGPIGTAVARRFLDGGWDVVLGSRSGGGAETLPRDRARAVRLDRRVPGQLEDALGGGADVLVDVAAFISNGESRFHTTSLANLAELVFLAANRPGDRIVNCGDPDPPTTLEICGLVAAALDRPLEPVPIPESGYERPELDNPWAVPAPFVVDMAQAAELLEYRPATTYAEAVVETATWLAGEARERDWSGTYLAGYFDYAAEDALLGADA